MKKINNMQTDYLSRQPYLDLLKSIITNQKENPTGYSFAIDGEWGSGKTWILQELEKQLLEENNNKYLIFHYNAWENDFYDEPLVAILSVMIDALDSFTKVKENLNKINAALLQTSITLFINLAISIVNHQLNEKAGLDFRDVVNDFKDVSKAKSNHAKMKKEIDNYSFLKKLITEIQNQISELSKEVNILLFVDELDRCLPEYTIKVLERLHHVCKDMPVIQIIAINKKDLSFGIARVFGMDNPEIDKERFADKYLQKFIQISMTLNNGTISGDDDILNGIDEGFTEALVIDKSFLIDFYKTLMSEINPRTQEHICKQVSLAHKLTVLSGHELKSYSYGLLCCELLYFIKYCILKDKSDFRIAHEEGNIYKIHTPSENNKCQIIDSRTFYLNLNSMFRDEYQVIEDIQLSPRTQDKQISAFVCNNGCAQLMNYFVNQYYVGTKWPQVYMMDAVFNSEREFLKYFKAVLKNF